MNARYIAACHGIQSGITILLSRDPDLPRCQAKHLRVGIDTGKAEMGGLARLLIAKGVITEEEYYEAVIDGVERERQSYEEEVSRTLGDSVKLG